MDAILLCLLLAMFCCGVNAVFIAHLIRTRSASGIVVAVVAAMALLVVSLVGSVVLPGSSFDSSVWSLLQEAKHKSLLVAFAGMICGLAWGVQVVLAQSGRRGYLASVIAVIGISTAVVIGLLMAWDDAFDIEGFKPIVLAEEYVIEELLKTEQVPIRLAINDTGDTIYFSTYSTGLQGVYGGSIYAIDVSNGVTQAFPRLVASSPALYRTFGLAHFRGDLYVSRAGHAANAVDGSIIYANMGAVTKLQDLNGDGEFEFLHDVIRDIPAARGPDTMHQNNGIAFDNEGNLFVAVGSADDRSIDQHPWSGTILKLSDNTDVPEVFARGLRNPFGICCGPSGTLFVTDNDCAEDPGDEVNFVTEDGHYGHPFAIPGDKHVAGFSASVIPPDPRSNYCGITFTPPLETPSGDGIVFVCDRLASTIRRLRVRIKGDSCTVVENIVFARVPSPIDVVASRNGDLFVASLLKQKIYRIRRK